MRISDWSSDVCPSDLAALAVSVIAAMTGSASGGQAIALPLLAPAFLAQGVNPDQLHRAVAISSGVLDSLPHNGYVVTTIRAIRSEEHTSELQSLMRISYAVFCLKKKKYKSRNTD